MDALWHDLRAAWHGLRRRPAPSLVAVLTLTLGIGVSTSMFSVLYGVMLKPLPYREPDRIVRLFSVGAIGGRSPWSGANYVDFADRATAYEAIAGYDVSSLALREEPFPSMVTGAVVTPGFFQVFGVTPQAGRVFSPEADPPGGERAVVLSDALWKSRFGGEPDVVGQRLEMNGVSTLVVGIMPAGFDFPDGAQFWTVSRSRVPDHSGTDPADPAFDRQDRYFLAIARLREGTTLTQARREGETVIAQLAAEYPADNPGERFDLVPLQETLVGPVRPMLLALFGAVGLLLLIACTNVTNLLLARAAGRAREIALRGALGAGRGRIARLVLAESLLLALVGGAGGLLLALWGTDALLGLAGDLPRAAEVTVSLPVLGFALGLALLSGVLFGLAPALWLARGAPAAILREGSGREGAATYRSRLRQGLVSAEIALSLVLLVGSGLMVRTLAILSRVDPGFSQQEVLTGQIWLTGLESLPEADIHVFQEAVLERIRALPGVVSAGAVLSLPIGPWVSAVSTWSVEGREMEPGSEPRAGLQAASPDYFETIGIPLHQGRTFTEADRSGSLPVAVVSDVFADRFFPGEDPLGRRIGSGNPLEEDFEWLTIVGVVGSTRPEGLDSEPRAEVFQPFAQSSWDWMALVVRTTVAPATLEAPLRRAVMEARADQPVMGIRTMAEVLHDSLARRRYSLMMLGLFATLALLLAGVGLYGVMSFLVTQRSREIGIRMAVGAGSAEILRLVAGEGGRMLVVGLAAGVVLAVLLGWFLRALLYGVPPTDPVSFLGAAGVLTPAVMVALGRPIRRALRTDPMISLRME
jgi:putative ABC transport system permease protein